MDKKSLIAKMCFVFAITISVGIILFSLNSVAFAFEYQITTVLSGSSANVDEEALQEANRQGKEVAIQIGEEGFTLLRNENKALPLGEDERKVSVFGRASSDKNFWYMGLGSGSGPKSGRVTLYGGLEEAGLELAPALKDKYNSLPARTDTYSDAETGLNHTTAYELYEPGQEWLNEDGMLADAAENYPTAIVVIGRGGSEDGDYDKYQTFTDDNGREVAESAARKDTTRLYNEISAQEEELLSLVRQLYDKVIVVINSGNVMELGFLEKYNVDAAINAYFPGNYGTIALGNLLTGKANPSGKTPDIYPYDITTMPSLVTSGRKDVVYDSGVYSVDYSEGIYVGYKWYETAYAERFWGSSYAQERWGYYATESSDHGYDEVVQYPFGYGLSYTEFEWELIDVQLTAGSTEDSLAADAKITFTVFVENTGDVPGKDVVELYCTPPYNDGGIEKSATVLAAFAKTGELTPVEQGGKGEFVTLEVSLYDLASYDCYDKNGNAFVGYEAEAGEYTFSLRTDSHHIKDVRGGGTRTFTVTEGHKYETDPVTGEPVVNRFTTQVTSTGISSSRQDHEPAIGDRTAYSIDGGQDVVSYISRSNFTLTYPVRNARNMKDIVNGSLADATPVIDESEVRVTTGDTSVQYTVADIIKVKTDDSGNPVPNTEKPVLDDNGNPVLNDSGEIEYQPQYYIDEEVFAQVVKRMDESTLYNMIAAGSSSSLNGASEIGLPGRNYKDGPSGISATFVGGDSGEFTTNFPCEVAVAATWNWFIAYQLGLSVGDECAATNTAGWYGPSVNIHRSPLGGRNFENYSEDPYLSGVMAAYTVRGAKETGTMCWLKHFAVNEEEIGRVGKYTWLTEQTLRETYLFPFRMAVQKGGANAMMAAFNRVGSVRAGSSYALLTEVLRGEWGFNGAVITDAYASGRNDPDESIRAGVDCLLSWSTATVTDWDDTESATAINAMQRACANVLRSYIDSRYTALMADTLSLNNVIGSTPEMFAWWKIILIGFDVLVAGACVVWSIVTGIKCGRMLRGKAGASSADGTAGSAAESAATQTAAAVSAEESVFAETYEKLSDTQKAYFEKVRAYAMAKEGATERISGSGITIKLGGKPIVKLKVRRGFTVASYKLNNETLDRCGAAYGDTVIKLKDDASAEAACNIVDAIISQYEKAREEAAERRRAARRARAAERRKSNDGDDRQSE